MKRFFQSLIFFLILPFTLFAQYQNNRFERISVEQGLPSTTVKYIVQDRKGFMWFGTTSGLCRYDGFNFKIYRNIKGDESSLKKNSITGLYIDKDGTLWIGTSGCLQKYNPETDDFTNYPLGALFTDDINDINGDSSGTVWISNQLHRLVRFDKIKEEFRAVYLSISKDMLNKKHLKPNILISKENILWVATGSGLYKQQLPLPSVSNKKASLVDTVQFISYVNKMPKGLKNHSVKDLFVDGEGTIWISAGGGNILRYDNQEDNFKIYRMDPHNKNSLKSKSILFINENEDGHLIIGTKDGCNMFDKKSEKYIDSFFDDIRTNTYYRDRSGVEWYGTLHQGIIKVSHENKKFPPPWKYRNDVIFVDNNGIVWLGSLSGLYELNRKKGEFNLYKVNKTNLETIFSNNILAICENTDNRLWISTHGGLYAFDKIRKSFLRPAIEIGKRDWTCICKEKTGILWLGKEVLGEGLYRYDPILKDISQFTNEHYDKSTISHNNITKILEDSRGDLWIGTQQGLDKFDRINNSFKRYYIAGSESERFQYDEYIHDILEPQNGSTSSLWIAAELGLYQFDRESGRFTLCRLANGQALNEKFTGRICRMAEDGDGNLWFSSNYGLGKYNPVTKTLKKYYQSDGLQGNTFTKAHFKSKDGEMFFGGPNGVSIFYPDSIKDDPGIPNIAITGFKKFNKEVKLDSNLSYIKKIILTYDENVFSFEYASLNFTNPRRNQFAHKLEGFERDWIYTGNKHDVAYTNLDPGEYTFRVKGSNSDGIWNEEGTSIKIIITPPWWKTNLAYVFYIFLIGSIVFSVWKFQMNRLKMKHALELEHVHAEKLEEVDRLKSKFFANISHEFRTPLTLIKGPVKQILDGEFTGNLKEQCKMILRNSDRLLGLINQILDISKLESGKIKLQVVKTDILQFLKGLIITFSPLADRKKVTLKFTSKQNELSGYVDRDKLEKILTNLLSNAFKFTPEGGEIILDCGFRNAELEKKDNSKIRIPNSEFRISLSNTGPGIPADHIDKIFDRFYQADDKYKKDGEGSGIGLALTKELVELHHGTINVQCTKAKKQPPKSPFSGAVAVSKISRSFLRKSLEMTVKVCHFDRK